MAERRGRRVGGARTRRREQETEDRLVRKMEDVKARAMTATTARDGDDGGGG